VLADLRNREGNHEREKEKVMTEFDRQWDKEMRREHARGKHEETRLGDCPSCQEAFGSEEEDNLFAGTFPIETTGQEALSDLSTEQLRKLNDGPLPAEALFDREDVRMELEERGES
jgi:hypothetical protein